MSDLTEIGVTGDECPYCGQPLPKRPGRKAKAPCCGKPIFVRTRPADGKSVLLREDQLPLLESQWATDYQIKQHMRQATGAWDRQGVATVDQAKQRAFESARQHMARQARNHLACPLYESLEVRLSGKHREADLCDLYADADLWGLGRGVYPKAEAPVPPFHEGCMCSLAPRFGLRATASKPRLTLSAALDQHFAPALAARIREQMRKNPVKKVKEC